jgi:predicted NAD/FAD-dependent oxidoreductase
MCTKFPNGHDDPSLSFDMGVQYLSLRGILQEHLQEFSATNPVIAPWPDPGMLKRVSCTCNGPSLEVRVSTMQNSQTVVGVPSMSFLGRALASSCQGLEVHVDRTAHVMGRSLRTGKWTVEWGRASANLGQLTSRPELAEEAERAEEEFDAVVLAFEANKIVKGCGSGYKMVSPSATSHLATVASRVRTSQQWNLMVAFERPAGIEFQAAYVDGHPSIGWIANNSSKPGRSSASYECWMVLTTQAWAQQKMWKKSQVEKALLSDFVQLLRALGGAPSNTVFLMAGRWGNNTSGLAGGEQGIGDFPARAFHDPLNGIKDEAYWDKQGMGACGDWCKGFGVCDAYESGWRMGDIVLSNMTRT